MTEWSDAIKNAIVVVIIVVVVGIIFGFVYMAMQANQEGQDNLSDQLSSFDQKSFSTYDGTQISGQQVIACIQQYTGTDICVAVKTADSDGFSYYCRSLDQGTAVVRASQNDWRLTAVPVNPVAPTQPNIVDNAGAPTTIANATNKGYTTYINPSARFDCVLNYNGNGQVTGITCTQDGAGT